MSTKPRRLDAELVRRGLAATRTQAQRAIAEGNALVRGLPVTRPAALVSSDAEVALASEPPRFVSRGGDKLEGALKRLEVRVVDRGWLDLGASTGGFTDCLLQRGAGGVTAVDVGYGQLSFTLRQDPRVIVIERRNARRLRPADLPWAPDGVTADVSFISLRLLLPAISRVAAEGADLVLLVKPQFEVGRRVVPRGGVVRDPELWVGAIESVTRAAEDLSFALVDCVASELLGPAGNREFFVHLRRGAISDRAAPKRAVEEVSE